MSSSLRILIVGNSGGLNVGGSLYRASQSLGYTTQFANSLDAFNAPRWRTTFYWHLFGHRPPYLARFSGNLLKIVTNFKPKILITTGLSPINGQVMQALKDMRITTVSYLTDDPWNPSLRANWFFDALKRYSIIFTPRLNNIDDIRNLGCRRVQYLPFGYDHDLMYLELSGNFDEGVDTLFVGGADKQRVTFLAEVARLGLTMTLYGDYWTRFPDTVRFAKGRANPDELRVLTRNAKVNICLVRRANRDGHVMRSFEIPACGGCMLAEDTSEHRAIFGDEGEAVLYFSSARELVDKCTTLLNDSALRQRLARSAYERIQTGQHTYQDRLRQMLAYTHEQ